MKTNYLTKTKRNYFSSMAAVLHVLLFMIAAFFANSSYSQKAKMSVPDEKWGKTGIYKGYTPEQEILEKRNRTTKHFKNANGSFTAQVGSAVHYQDEKKAWQDIDFSITENASAYKRGYKFSNETNEIKSYFPENSTDTGILIYFDKNVAFNWWQNPKLEFTSNGTAIKSLGISRKNASVINNKTLYSNVYPGISEEFEIISGGMENNTIIHSLSSTMNNLPSNAYAEFSQTIELKKGWQVMTGNKIQDKAFQARTFHIKIPGSEDLSFSPIVVFDNAITKQEALFLAKSPKDKLTADQVLKLNSHVIQCDYVAEFTKNGLQITTKLPVAWLKSTGRSFPVTIDPTVTIGTEDSGDYHGPLSHWYGYQRHASLYLQSELGITGGIITEIEYYRTAEDDARTKPTKVYMRNTTATELSGTDAWNSATYTGGLTPLFDDVTTQDESAGWKSIPLTNAFGYASDNLLVMVYDEYGGSGSVQYMALPTATNRQAYSRRDNTNPGDGAATAIENRLPSIRITYSIDPPVISAISPTSGCTNTGSLVIFGNNLSGTNAVTIGGTPVASFTVDSTTQITAVVGTGTTGTVSVTTSLGTATSAATYTVNISPVVSAINGGANTVCVGQNTPAFTNTTPGGIWSVINGTGSATINNSGILTGVTSGQVTINYRVNDGTCSTDVTANVTVNALPPANPITPANPTVCNNQAAMLSMGTTDRILFSEDFETGSLGSFNANVISGDTGNLADWAIQSSPYIPGGSVWHTELSSGSQFAISISDYSGAQVNTAIESGTINTMGFESLSLEFRQYYSDYSDTNDFAYVEASSDDGVTWDTIETYTADSTDPVNFDSVTISLNAYANVPNMKFRFRYVATWNDGWAVDDVVLRGTGPTQPIWSPTAGLYTDAAATIPYTGAPAISVYAKPTVASTYTATTTNTLGCSYSASANVTISNVAVPDGLATQEFTAGQRISDLEVTGTNLQWYANASMTIGLPTTTPLVNGSTYYVTQSNGGCRSSSLAVTVNLVLKVNDFDKDAFVYYPNPVKDILHLSNTTAIKEIAVYNMLGQKIMAKQSNSAQSQIDMTKLSAGNYILKIKTDDSIKTVKITKQ